jgi:hypothetical protein
MARQVLDVSLDAERCLHRLAVSAEGRERTQLHGLIADVVTWRAKIEHAATAYEDEPVSPILVDDLSQRIHLVREEVAGLERPGVVAPDASDLARAIQRLGDIATEFLEAGPHDPGQGPPGGPRRP